MYQRQSLCFGDSAHRSRNTHVPLEAERRRHHTSMAFALLRSTGADAKAATSRRTPKRKWSLSKPFRTLS